MSDRGRGIKAKSWWAKSYFLLHDFALHDFAKRSHLITSPGSH